MKGGEKSVEIEKVEKEHNGSGGVEDRRIEDDKLIQKSRVEKKMMDCQLMQSGLQKIDQLRK